MRCSSASVYRPSRSRWESISASAERIRSASCSRLISKLNTPTTDPALAALIDTFSARVLLPVDGRAPSTIMSERCSPPSSSSISL